jgi:hypothetical protein
VSYAGLIRASINLPNDFIERMDCRVFWREDALRAFAGNDDAPQRSDAVRSVKDWVVRMAVADPVK